MRKPAKTIDQIEQATIFSEEQKQDKRTEEKTLVVEREKSTGLCFIRYTAGGEIPNALKGKYTTIARAQAAVDNYLITKQQEEQRQQGGAEGSSSAS